MARIVAASYDEKGGRDRLLWMTEIRSMDDLVAAVCGRPGPVRLVGIDGLAGSGKTTLATRLSAAGGGWPVVHTDDFATHDDLLGWWPRVLAEVVEPLLAGSAVTYRPYLWATRSWGAPVHVEPGRPVLLEGVGATRRAWRDRLAMRVWVDAPRDVRLQRVLSRGDGSPEFWREWMAAEDAYVDQERPQHHADLVVDGNQRELVVLSAPRAATPTPASGPGSPPRR